MKLLDRVCKFFCGSNDTHQVKYANLKCSHCGVWCEYVGGVKSLSYDRDPLFANTECKNCGESTRWFVGAPVWISAEEVEEK